MNKMLPPPRQKSNNFEKGNRPLSPYIRLAWDSWLDASWDLPTRVIFDYEFICLQGGELDVVVEGVHHHAVPGDVIIFRPGQRHALHVIGSVPIHQPHIHCDLIADENSPFVYISFADIADIAPDEHKLFREDILDDLCPQLPPVIHPKNVKTIEGLLMSIIHEKDNRMVYSDLVVNGMFMQFLGEILREVSLGEERGAPHFSNQSIAQQVREYLNRNMDRSVSLDELGENIHVSKYHLCRQFKRAFGVSPIQYHLDSRIDRAKLLLVTTDASIGDIAESVGFQSIYSFSRAFKKRENVSPSVYRR